MRESTQERGHAEISVMFVGSGRASAGDENTINSVAPPARDTAVMIFLPSTSSDLRDNQSSEGDFTFSA